ncbi:hypothetical protein ZWY2020_037798 [Hordeum vulgare]|nr:hypothetical protein ZWY2020_037798 [Hordeum vulgare]
MTPLHLYFLSIPLPVSFDADLVKHAADVVRLPTPILPPPRTLQFQRPITATSPSSSSSPSLLPHLLCYQPPQVCQQLRSCTQASPAPIFLDAAAVLLTATTSTS